MDPALILKLIDTVLSLGKLAFDVFKFILSRKSAKKPPSVDGQEDG